MSLTIISSLRINQIDPKLWSEEHHPNMCLDFGILGWRSIGLARPDPACSRNRGVACGVEPATAREARLIVQAKWTALPGTVKRPLMFDDVPGRAGQRAA
jgi:hypothetical protein